MVGSVYDKFMPKSRASYARLALAVKHPSCSDIENTITKHHSQARRVHSGKARTRI